MAHTATSLSAVNSIMNNPVIPEEKKFELVMQEHRKNQAMQTTTQEFVESGQYAKLPTEAERQKAEKDLKEAKEKELGIENPAEKTEEKDQKEDPAAEENVKDEAAAAEEAVRAAQMEKEVKTLTREREMSRMEAETTPEALKVKRARARAAYQTSSTEVRQQMVDVKVR